MITIKKLFVRINDKENDNFSDLNNALKIKVMTEIQGPYRAEELG